MLPRAKMPTVLLPVEDPPFVEAVAAVATALVSPTYVYLLRTVPDLPIAKIPSVLLPAAEPAFVITEEAVAEVTTQPE
jgi:hypothetical protein